GRSLYFWGGRCFWGCCVCSLLVRCGLLLDVSRAEFLRAFTAFGQADDGEVEGTPRALDRHGNRALTSAFEVHTDLLVEGGVQGIRAGLGDRIAPAHFDSVDREIP